MMDLIKQAHTWNGVSTRKQFWLTQLMLFAVGFVGSVVSAAMYPALLAADPYAFTPVDIVVTLATFYASITIFKRRLNDAGWSGWWMLFPLLNFVVAGFFATKTEDNKYNN